MILILPVFVDWPVLHLTQQECSSLAVSLSLYRHIDKSLFSIFLYILHFRGTHSFVITGYFVYEIFDDILITFIEREREK